MAKKKDKKIDPTDAMRELYADADDLDKDMKDELNDKSESSDKDKDPEDEVNELLKNIDEE